MSAKITAAIRAKKALIDLLKVQAVPGAGGTLAALATTYGWGQVTVAYGWTGGEVGPACVYGGSWRFDAADEVAEGPGVLIAEVITVQLYVRTLARPPVDVEVVDVQAEALGNAVAGVCLANPQMAGQLTYLGIDGGLGDYSANGTETVAVHQYSVSYRSHLTWRG